MGFTIRRDNDTFLTTVEPPIVPGPAMDIHDIQRKICAILERGVTENPCQWFMFDSFWHNGGAYGRDMS
jgi:lauroyl/myristoyl acyltransferase